MATLSRASMPFSSPIGKGSEESLLNSDIPTTPLRSSLSFTQSFSPRSPLGSPPPLSHIIPTSSSAVPPAHFVDFEFKKPSLPRDTPRNLIRALAKFESEEKTPKKLIGDITAPETPLGNVHKRNMELEKVSPSKMIASVEKTENPDMEKLYELISSLNREVQYLESVKTTLSKVLEDTEKDRAKIQEMAKTILYSDQQLSTVDDKITRLREDLDLFHQTIQQKKREEADYYTVTQISVYFVLFVMILLTLITMGALLSTNDSIDFSNAPPTYMTLTPRPT